MSTLKLPEMVVLSNRLADDVALLYPIFKTEIRDRAISFMNKKVIVNRNKKEGDPYEEGFWHLITRKEMTTRGEERVFDKDRAKRFSWIRSIILQHPHPDILYWQEVDPEDNRLLIHYLWYRSGRFIVILKAKWGDCFLLASSFYVDTYNFHRYQKRYDKYST